MDPGFKSIRTVDFAGNSGLRDDAVHIHALPPSAPDGVRIAPSLRAHRPRVELPPRLPDIPAAFGIFIYLTDNWRKKVNCQGSAFLTSHRQYLPSFCPRRSGSIGESGSMPR
jgi:hypothetical protein